MYLVLAMLWLINCSLGVKKQLLTCVECRLKLLILCYRYRGTVQVYDFSVDQMTQGVPDICLSTYDEPEASHYNISLAFPYDKL